MNWTQEGIEIKDKQDADKMPSGLRVYRYTPSLAKDGREIIAMRRYYYKRDGTIRPDGWRGPNKQYHTYYCPIELYQVQELIEALQKLMGMEAVETPAKVAEDYQARRLMR